MPLMLSLWQNQSGLNCQFFYSKWVCNIHQHNCLLILLLVLINAMTSFDNPQPTPCHSVYISYSLALPQTAQRSTFVSNIRTQTLIPIQYTSIFKLGFQYDTKFKPTSFPGSRVTCSPSYLLDKQDTHSMVYTINYYIPHKYPYATII